MDQSLDKAMKTISLITFFVVSCYSRSVQDEYLNERQNLIDDELRLSLGGRIKLNKNEEIANDILMKLKFKELEECYQNPSRFNLSHHYFSYKNEIEKSPVYQIIKKMPKGAVLHVHSSLMLGSDYILKLTYEDNLYICYDDRDIQLLFSDKLPQRPCPLQWQLLRDIRNRTENTELIDKGIKKHFSLVTEAGPETDIDKIWKKFEKSHEAKSGLLNYRPMHERYFYDALKKFYEDNIMYLEIRCGLAELYELDGTKHEQMETPKLYRKIVEKFTEDHPDFIGVKLIVSKHRLAEDNDVRKALNMTLQIREEMPEMLAGFDLVGQEDKGKPLLDFLPALKDAQKEDISFFFHCGETNWYGSPADENLIDAILLGTKRIGHGFALMKHPVLLEIVKARDIAVEVNVISNAVLALIEDVRNHPLSLYLAMGLPVVLSSDDPGAWDAEPISHDFYVTFMGVASQKADLKVLKKLAINSLAYSALDAKRKRKALLLFNQKWDKFIKDIICDEGSYSDGGDSKDCSEPDCENC